MKLSFLKSFKSIKSFPEIELPDFVVLTGVNGAGKSHLLEAIENGSMRINDIVVDPQTRPIRRFDFTNLIPQDTAAFAPSQITQERSSFWNEITAQINTYRPQLSQTLQQLNRADLDNLKMREIVSLTPEKLIGTGSTPEQANQIVQSIQNMVTALNQAVTSRFVQNDPIHRPRLVSLIESSANVPLIAFEEDDFYNLFPRNWQPVDMFQQSFGRLFAEYQRNWVNNRYRFLENSEGDSVSFLTKEEFLDKYGIPPWEFVNSVLEAANLDFRINQPPKYEDRPYEPILTDQSRKSQVKFNDLSSGERVLMSFALCLYYAGDHRQTVDYPKVLLFDEIDAPLHPSMTQSLINTIQEVLVKQHGIKVIMTTHSPSTVALSPEESLYAMYKSDEKRLQKTTKDRALSLLTNGVPTLSINYENRRQVFVESDYDVLFYGQLYDRLKDHLMPEVSLSFISSGTKGQGSCSQVKEIVNRLRRAGNNTVYGIVDWDLTNFGSEHVKVLGDGNRYSIENYILDPVLVAAFLLREKLIERSKIGLNEQENYVHFSTFDNSRLQSIADFVLNDIKPHMSQSQAEERTQCQYLSGQAVDLPNWFLHVQGHQLEKSLKEAFPPLKRFQKEADLKKEIITKVIDDLPLLIPDDIVGLFKNLQAII
jgi:ABC-type uncharacterized transport system ATPase component